MASDDGGCLNLKAMVVKAAEGGGSADGKERREGVVVAEDVLGGVRWDLLTDGALECDVVAASHLYRCVAAGKLVELDPSELLHVSQRTLAKFSDKLDALGDDRARRALSVDDDVGHLSRLVERAAKRL